MKIFPNRGKDKKDNSLGLFHAEAAAISAESAGVAYQSPSLIAAGAGGSTVAFLSTITNLILALLLIKVPSLVEGKTPMKRTVVLMAIVNSFTWIPIIFVFIFFKNINPMLLIGLWIFGLVPAALMGPLRDNWVANIVPSDKMGRYLSWRSAIAGIFYLVAFNIMGFTLFKSAGNIGRGFAIVLSIAFLASLASTFLYSSIHSPPTTDKPQTAPKISFGSFLKGARKEHLGTFILFAALFNFAVNLSSPLLSVYLISSLKFTFMTYTLVISCEYVARVLSLGFWGKQVDKSGSLRVLGVASHLIPFVPILWLFSGGNIIFLCIAQLFSGIVWAAFDLSTQTFIYKSTLPEQRLHYIAYYRSLTTFSAALGTLASALLLSSMFHIFGSQILGMLLVSAILRMAVVRLMLPKLKPGGIPDAIVHEELARELAYVNYPTRQGLYYHPEVWSRFTKPVAALGNIIGQAVNKITPKPAGLYYNPQRWSSYMGQNSNLRTSAIQANDEETSKSGLYHNKKAWASYMQQTSVLMESESQTVREGLIRNPEAWASFTNQMIQTDTGISENSKSGRKGLLYDPEAWERMMNQAVKADTRMTEDLKPVRKGLLYDPEAWARFMNQTAIDEAKAIDRVKTTRSGIFYDSQKWGDYLKQSMVLNATTMRTGGDSQVTRQPIFYHPELWGDYKNQSVLSREVNFKAGVNVKSNRKPLLYHPEEWDRTFDPAMVHIGRKSAIGTVITRQNPVKNTNHQSLSGNLQTINRPATAKKRVTTSPSPA